MINPSSHPLAEFDQRLLSVEELFLHRRPQLAIEELAKLPPEAFASAGLERGLFLSLSSESNLLSGNYEQAIECGLSALELLAPSSMNRRVGRVLWNLSKCYSLTGELSEADMRARDAISAFRRAEHRPGVVLGLNELAKIASIRSEYSKATEFLQDALILAEGDPGRELILRSNIGRLHIYTGRWDEAEKLLLKALEHDLKNKLDLPATRKLLSLGYLSSLRRDFSVCEERYAQAHELIEANNLGRERLNLAEYRGLVALMQGDYRLARTILTESLAESKELAPDSALVTQIGRLLTEALMGLELYDDAFSLAQQTLERCERLGEKVEQGVCNSLLGHLYALRSSDSSKADKQAAHNFDQGIAILRAVGDPFILAQTLMRAQHIYGASENELVLKALNEAVSVFEGLGVAIYSAEAEFAFAAACFQAGKFSDGYAPLRRARGIFETLGDSSKLRKVELALASYATDAVAHSISRANPFSLFGGFVGDSDSVSSDSSCHSGDMFKTIETLGARTSADRVIVMSSENTREIFSTPGMTENERVAFVGSFDKLLGEEFSIERPTIIFDSSIDPYINELAPSSSRTLVNSVIVTPLRVANETIGYMYLDRLCDNADGQLGARQSNTFESFKPFSQEELDLAVGFSDFVALELAQSQKQRLLEDNKRLKEQMQEKVGFETILTRSPQMLEMLTRIRQVVNSDISITITGETGSGKDLLAKAIHYNSNRREHRFISVNCAALPETLLESELFGYVRGAFTGADRDKPGLFEEADGGAFFLDEIGDMPLTVQAKILRVLEEKEVVRLGESTPRKVDVRIISATHVDLQIAMEKGTFRSDLYYRLSALCFHLPSLRERKEDIPLLIERFSEGSGITFSPDSIAAMVKYDWPGNIRELENEVKKLCLIAGESKRVTPELLSVKITGSNNVAGSGLSEAVGLDKDSIAVDQTAMNWSDGKIDFSLYDFIAAHEKRFIAQALEQSHGVKKHAAAKLNIPESTLRLKIKQYDINFNDLGPVH